jgi:transposase InsO family protein
MSRARLVITAVVLEGRSQAEVARSYGVSPSWVSRLVARYGEEGEAAFEPRSKRPKNSANALSVEVVTLICSLRRDLAGQGLDAGPQTIRWHLEHHHDLVVAPSTIMRHLRAAGLVEPQPKKRPRSSYIRFEAEQPNETWQADFTHYRLTRADGEPGADTEVLSWIDDHSRLALSITAHSRVSGPMVRATFRKAVGIYGVPASTLTDNGFVFTTRLAGGKGGRNALETELRALGVLQKNSRPNHPTTCGKVERFQQTMKRWLRKQPGQPTTILELQVLLNEFRTIYNETRPHSSLDHRATPATAYEIRPKASPGDRSDDVHDRVRRDRIDETGTVSLRLNGQMHHIGVGRTHFRTHVVILVHDLDVRIVHASTGELLRELTIDPAKTYHGTGAPKGPTRR